MASDASAGGCMVLRVWLEEAAVPELRVRITYGYEIDAALTVTRVECTIEEACDVVRAWLAALAGQGRRSVPCR